MPARKKRALALVSLPIVALALARALTLAVRRRAVHAAIQGGECCIARPMVLMLGKGKNITGRITRTARTKWTPRTL